MDNLETKPISIQFKLVGIELINCSLLPPIENPPTNRFGFNINLESRTDYSKKLIFVVVSIEITPENQKKILGSVTVSCIFEVANFDDIVMFQSVDEIRLQPQPLEVLNLISISTTRGILFSTFRGTYLHHAILPIIDPKSIIPKSETNEISTPNS